MFNKIVIVYDHRVNVKYIEKIKQVLNEASVQSFVVSEEENVANDYPLLVKRAKEEYKKVGADGIILLCGSGVGMNMVINKFDGFRGLVAHSEEEAYFARSHENANALCFGVGVEDGIREIKPFCRRKMARIVLTFLSTEFAGGRHERRVNQIKDIEKEN